MTTQLSDYYQKPFSETENIMAIQADEKMPEPIETAPDPDEDDLDDLDGTYILHASSSL